jgi:polyphosphate kinase
MSEQDRLRLTLAESEPVPPLFNRELSWIEFNARVLDEALNSALALLERLKISFDLFNEP